MGHSTLTRNIDAAHSRPRTPPQSHERTAASGRRILDALLQDTGGRVAVRLWNGDTVAGAPDAPCTLCFRQPGALRDLVLRRDLVRLAEHYLRGGVDIEGDAESVFALADQLVRTGIPARRRLLALALALRLPSRAATGNALGRPRAAARPRRNSRETISHHYDVGNAFYRLWLDPEMVYSCAYFRDERQTLADAQHDKLDYICRKLRLRRGQRLLDIGCGWGALLRWAAHRYGVHAHGITLSEEQYRYAQQRIRAEALDDQVSVQLCDYRDLPADRQYDRVVSVGMFEHVGLDNFPAYFGSVKRVLKPGGVFLNHGITSDSDWQRTPASRFTNLYVFPDGQLTTVSAVARAMEQAGFELFDVESLRRHYHLTLRHWVRRLESARQQAVALSSDTVYRLWRLYMSGAAHFFDEGSLNLYQILAGHAGQRVAIPLRRDDLYRDPYAA